MFYFIVGSSIIVIFIFILYFINNKTEFNLVNTDNNDNNTQEIKSNIQQIPKIIIQTWKSNTVPQRYIKLIESVKINNPDYQYFVVFLHTVELHSPM